MEDSIWEKHLDWIKDQAHPGDLSYGLLEAPLERTPYLNVFLGFYLSINDILSKSVVILGQTGVGKTNLVACFIEELLGVIPYIPISVVDLDGEYTTIKKLYPFFHIVGNSEESEYIIPQIYEDIPAFAVKLARDAFNNRLALDIDFSNTEMTQRYIFLASYLKELYATADRRYKEGNASPHIVLLDEAQNWIPLRIYADDDRDRQLIKEVKDWGERIAKQGRRRGLSSIIATQRNQEIERAITSQAQTRIYMRVSEKVDLLLYSQLFGESYSWCQNSARKLKNGEVWFESQKYKRPHTSWDYTTKPPTKIDYKPPLMARLRHSIHPSETPGWKAHLKRSTKQEPQKSLEGFV